MYSANVRRGGLYVWVGLDVEEDGDSTLARLRRFPDEVVFELPSVSGSVSHSRCVGGVVVEVVSPATG